jgi:pyruvate kinase
MMELPSMPAGNTKIIGTIGPASRASETLKAMMRNGMAVARLNLSHGTLERHAQVIRDIRSASSDLGQRVEIWGDLPGSKMRIGRLTDEPVCLVPGQPFILRADECVGDATFASVRYEGLAKLVVPGVDVYLNDGLVHLRVNKVEGAQILCQVLVGGQLYSNDGMNVPGIDLNLDALGGQNHTCLTFAAEWNLDAVSPSFVRDAGDIERVREGAAELSYSPFVLAKIERALAIENFDGLLESADAIVIARGDLGVETPFEEIALLQKRLIQRSNLAGRPAITATHMLESMVHRRLPTRAEVADVTNAILDGSACLALCAETAIGNHPAEAVKVLARIIQATERQVADRGLAHLLEATEHEGGLIVARHQAGGDSAFSRGPEPRAGRQG